jgi:hypothetical protein
LQPYDGDPAHHRNVTGAVLPVACASCHRASAARVIDTPIDGPAAQSSRKAFLDYLRQGGESTGRIAELEREMGDPSALPTLFLPKGLRELLQQRIAAKGARD